MAITLPSLSVEFEVPRDPAVFERDHRRALTKANEAAAIYHHEHHIPRHFEGFAGAKYGYPRRSLGYEKRKQHRYGHKLPLVYTGKTRAAVTSNRRVQKTYKGATLILRIPIKGGSGRFMDDAARKRLGIRAPKYKQLDSQEQILKRIVEIEAIAPDEIRTLSRIIRDVYTAEINQPGVRRRVRFRTR